MDLWHTFDEQGGGAVTQEFGLEGEPYPDMLDPDDSHIIPNAGMQATAEFAPREENGTTAEAEGEADAILQTALDAQRPDVPPHMWHASPGMVPVGSGSASPGEGAPAGEAGAAAESSSEDEETLSKRYAREHSESMSEDGIEDDEEEDDDDMSDSDDPERPRRPANARPKRSASGGRRTRRNILPRIMRGERCGKCHTCLNPQMKKACLTMRQRQMDELSKKGNLPVSMLGQLAPNGGLPPPARSKAQAPARKVAKKATDTAGRGAEKPARAAERTTPKMLDLFTQEIKAITSRNGGVEARHLDTLQRLFRREEQLERRLVLMTILKSSPKETLQGAVAGQTVVAQLQRWLQAAVETKEYRMAFRVIETLDKLPIDLATFQSTGVGKTMAQLAKKGPEEVKKSALQLVSRWKESMKGVTPAADAAKRPRDAKTAAEQGATKKPKFAAGAKKIGAPLPRQSSVDSRDSARAAPMEVDDDAMFQQRDKKPKPSLQDSVSQMKKTHQIKLLNEETARKLKAQEHKGEAGSKPDGGGTGQTSSAGVAEPAAATKDKTSEEASTTGKRPLPSTLVGSTAPLSTPLGSSRITGIGTGITRIGGQGSSLAPLSVAMDAPMDAASRAAAAAAKIPDPPPMPARTKAKKVSWHSDNTLVLVRWFLQADPAIAVREDARETTELDSGAPATLEEDHPPGFVSAAKREHQDEAAALRMHRLPDGEPQLGPAKPGQAGRPEAVPQRPPTAHFHAMVDWPTRFGGPPRAVNREREYSQPSDDERIRTPATQQLLAALQGVPDARYPNPIMIPTSPLEPPPDTTPVVATVRLFLEAAPANANPTPAPAPQALLPQPSQPQPQGMPQQQPSHPLPGPPMMAPMQAFGPGNPASGFAPQQNPGPFLRPQMAMSAPPPPARTGPPGIRPPPRSAESASSDSGRGRGARGRGRATAPGRGRWQGRGMEGEGPNPRAPPAARGRGRGGRQPEGLGRGSGNPAVQGKVPCRWYGTQQGCAKGDQCPFFHGT